MLPDAAPFRLLLIVVVVVVADVAGLACLRTGLLGSARAQRGDCGTSREDELVVTPADRAEDVARNAPVLVRYEHDADLGALRSRLADGGADGGADACAGQPVCLFEDARERGGSRREPVAGQVQWLDQRTVAFVPAGRLRADTDYFPLVTRAGFDAAARVELEFRTGENTDLEPPELDSHGDGIEVAVEKPPPECDLPDGTLRVTVIVPSARDDGDEESVEMLLFLTRAVGLRGPELRARERNASRDEGSVTLKFFLNEEEASDAICLALRAIDGLGRVSEGEPSLCLQPERGAHFEPLCSTFAPSRSGARSSTGWGSLIALAAAMFVRTRVRRRRGGAA